MHIARCIIRIKLNYIITKILKYLIFQWCMLMIIRTDILACNEATITLDYLNSFWNIQPNWWTYGNSEICFNAHDLVQHSARKSSLGCWNGVTRPCCCCCCCWWCCCTAYCWCCCTCCILGGDGGEVGVTGPKRKENVTFKQIDRDETVHWIAIWKCSLLLKDLNPVNHIQEFLIVTCV